MSRSQRLKGAAGERELAEILSDALGFVVKRKLGQARDGGHDIETGRFRWEVKRRKKIAVYDFMDQIEKACEEGQQVPIVAMRADGKDWLVMMRLEDAMLMIRNELPQR
jgi:Holliday junction resolvase